jgi:Phage T4 tail fibre
MKKSIKIKCMGKFASTIFIMLPLLGNAQWLTNGTSIYNSNTGNVGIGTSTPSAKLNVYNQNLATQVILGNPSTGAGGFTSLVFGTSADKNGFSYVESVKSSGTAYGDVILNRWGGNVGIGTTSPTTKFHVYEPTQNVLTKIETGGANTAAIIYKNNYEEWQVGNQAYGALGFTFASLSGIKMTIRSSGDVGIGTVSPDAKLAVKGTIHAQEVRVDLSVPGPDYVFEPTYDLKPLAEIEAYIKENKHLPEVPSAKEMEKNGVQLGEMNMLLLKKVEELTLYVIELKKQNEGFQKRIVQLEKE